MEPVDESITVRYMRLREMIDGPSIMAKTSLHLELLYDAVILLFDEYNNDFMKKDELVSNFIYKFQMTILELKSFRVNRFDFESKQIIGKGYFGEVELVIEKHNKDIFAMKVLRKNNLLIQKDNTCFEREKDIMASSNSPFLTQLHYAFQDFQNLYLLMDYHPGGDFLNLIKKFNGSLPEETAKFYIAELLLAVKHLHNMGFAHCDIKPDNMMLDRVGHLKLIDFGSSAKLDCDGKINTRVHIGTSEYLAPEMILFMQSNSKLKDVHGPQCDMWSVGIVAYEMVTGGTPFNSEQQAVIFPNVLNCGKILKYPTSIKVSPSYKEMIECLVCHVDKRFTVDMISELDIFLMINFNTLNDQVPPYIPHLMSDHDVSNFPVHERVRPAPNINDFKNQKQLSGRNLPFMGFTFSRQVPKQDRSYFMTNSPELETSIKIKRKQLEDAEVLIQSLQNKLTENVQLLVEYKRKVKKMEEENVLLHVNLTSLNSEIGRLTKISKASYEGTDDMEKKIAERVKNEIDKWEEKTINELFNIEKIKSLNEDLQSQNSELQSKISKHQNSIEMFQANEEDLNKQIIQAKLELNQVVWQLNEKFNIDTRVKTLMNEMKEKEDAFEMEKHKFNAENQCLQKKIVVMEKIIQNLKSKISQYIDKEILMMGNHKKIIDKMSSEFELKLNLLNQEKDKKIEKLHTEISNLQQFNESLNSFERHEKEFCKEETEIKLNNCKEEIQNLKLELKLLQHKQKTNEETICSLTENNKNAQNKFREKISKIQKDTNLEIKNKEEEFKVLYDNIVNLNKINESLQLNLEKETAERLILDKELSKMISQSKNWTSEKSTFERQIFEYKTKFNSSEAKLKALQGLITTQDEQLSGFEEIFHSLTNKEKQLIDDIKSKQDEIQKFICESQEVKKRINKEKSLQLLAESKSQTVENVQDNVKADLKLLNNQVREKNIEIASMKDKLNEVNSNLRDKTITFFTLLIEYEKVVKELNKIKSDFTATLSQKQMFKDSNVRLNSQLKAMVEDSNVMQSIIYKYQNSLIKEKASYEERLIKADTTNLQQSKLIDFLHTKLNVTTNKKWTLSDVLFSSKTKENIDLRETELLLTSEKKKSKDLKIKLCQTQTELNTIKSLGLLSTPLESTCFEFEATSPTNKSTSNRKSQPPAFHSFEVKIWKRNGFLCTHCQSEIMIRQQISQCRECRVLTHIKCSHELLPNCTLSNKEEKPILPNSDECQKSLKIESSVITCDNTKQIWNQKYAKLEQGLIQIFNDKHDTQPYYSLSLSMTSGIVKIFDVAESNDTTIDKNINVDYDQMFKIEVYSSNTGRVTSFLYIIVSSVTEKHKWLKTVREYLKNVECTIQSPDNHKILLQDLTEK